jgi:hypothetical protein
MNSNAQLKGDILLGDFGLSAGTQAPPTFLASIDLFYWYGASNSKKQHMEDDESRSNLDLSRFFFNRRLEACVVLYKKYYECKLWLQVCCSPVLDQIV